MKENIDELARLFNEGNSAYEQLDGLYDAIVPKRVQSPHLNLPREPEHPRASELLENTTTYVVEWILNVHAILGKADRIRYKMQFDNPQGNVGLRGMFIQTRTEKKLSDALDDFELRLSELRKIILDYETSSERTMHIATQVIEPASYDPKTRTIFFADEAIRFNANATYQSAICKLMFENPEKLWDLKGFLTVWDSQYDFIPALQKLTDWNKVYAVIKKINTRIANATDVADLFKLTTKSVRLNPKYITPSKKQPE